MERYIKQIRFSPFGEAGQRRLDDSTVLIAGVGALGTHLANSLARAGVGKLVLVDRDFVELSNLQRQILYDEADVTAMIPKAVAAKARLQAINSEIEVEAVVADIHWANLPRLLEGVDLVLDGSDNFDLRYLLNDACVQAGIPWIYGGVTGAHGMAMVVRPGQGPCLRCLIPSPPPPGSVPTCDMAGILAPAIQMITAFQAVEAMKVLAGRAEELAGGLFSVDLWDNRYDLIDLSQARRDDCPACQRREFPFLSGREEMQATPLCGANAVQVTPARPAELDLEMMAGRLSGAGKVEITPYLLRFSSAEGEMVLFRDGRAMIRGTQDPVQAKAVYTRLIGA
ncbi:thiazole biosynthesis adenylyltransferase ThiF [Heliobacterium gestii]|uniref:Thiazole biosynthesis adenylyltransferase ThiF n=1 Tax=Heliomicrobium gestii TaxID=2699 RepID=A0A845LKM1_HELGE|nr:ThiF family adenylyltransferase [Heliomicrobium gestii]MBM7867509.1 adenylyltransferase/sulfurtransferase [Heliomicrobium gestii]MZP43943.1 thiazole biosynthesis adenylyltransferase ThiF [Heliomicrobium gestii]